ncbi:hypothetical protein CYMTET_16127 [Cymbomonas tetramitiformis]|uniref:Uncharacterized protein n=1 Tax=Cymbomonas tetramitiformis TaxID=36881 RepID=A0AAE0GCM2_9CHLO|nr:hypothetical protein CYMTET_16127 [Cymbomonas tetramitiformis]
MDEFTGGDAFTDLSSCSYFPDINFAVDVLGDVDNAVSGKYDGYEEDSAREEFGTGPAEMPVDGVALAEDRAHGRRGDEVLGNTDKYHPYHNEVEREDKSDINAGQHTGRSGLTEQQRDEILARLAAERSERRTRVLSGAAADVYQGHAQLESDELGAGASYLEDREEVPSQLPYFMRQTPYEYVHDEDLAPPEPNDDGGAYAPNERQRGALLSPPSSISDSRAPTPIGFLDHGNVLDRPDSPKDGGGVNSYQQDLAAPTYEPEADPYSGGYAEDPSLDALEYEMQRDLRYSAAPPPPHRREAWHEEAPELRTSVALLDDHEPHPKEYEETLREPPAGNAQRAAPAAQMPRPRRPSSAPRERPPPKVTKPQEFALSKPSSRHNLESVARQVAEEKDKNLTFKPQTNSGKKNATPGRLQQLAEPRRHDKWLGEKKKYEEESLKGCTFKPQTGRKPTFKPRNQVDALPEELSAAKRRCIGARATPALLSVALQRRTPRDRCRIPVQERLYQQSETKFVAREKAKKELEEAQLGTCPFAPRINNYNAKKTYKPLQERLADLQRSKSEKIARARMAQELEDPELTFQPRLNQTSMRIAEVLEERTEEAAMLGVTASSAHLIERRMKKQEEIQSVMNEECTFQPAINQTSERMIQVMETFGRNPDFVQRQQEQQDVTMYRKHAKQRDAVDEECKFVPQTNSSQVLHASRHVSMCHETQAEKMERLSYKDKIRKESLKENLQQQHFAQYSFEPKLNNVSRSMARSTTLGELVKDERRQKVLSEAKKAAEEAERAQCTFRPELVAKSKKLPPRPYQVDMNHADTITRRIAEYQKEKEQRLEEYRAAQQYEELEACTFSPATNKTKVPATRSSTPVVVRGLGRHLELQEMAKRMKVEHEDRAAKVFLENPNGGPKQQYTIPQPFNLDHKDCDERARLRKSKAQQELDDHRHSECTFRPRTLHGQNKELIQHILSQPDYE